MTQREDALPLPQQALDESHQAWLSGYCNCNLAKSGRACSSPLGTALASDDSFPVLPSRIPLIVPRERCVVNYIQSGRNCIYESGINMQ